MSTEILKMSPAGRYRTYSARLDSPPLSLPTTRFEAKETAEIAIKYGIASVVFGLVLWFLLEA